MRSMQSILLCIDGIPFTTVNHFGVRAQFTLPKNDQLLYLGNICTHSLTPLTFVGNDSRFSTHHDPALGSSVHQCLPCLPCLVYLRWFWLIIHDSSFHGWVPTRQGTGSTGSLRQWPTSLHLLAATLSETSGRSP